MTQERKQYLATTVAFLIGLIVGGSLTYLWMTRGDVSDDSSSETSAEVMNQDSSDNSGNTTDDKITGIEVNTNERSASVEVFDQPAGNNVIVREVTMEVDGWLVVHEGDANLIGNALGAARRDRGVHSSVAIPLLRSTEAGKLYRVIVYRDNGDGVFSLETDFPILGAGSAPVMTAFTAQ